MLPRISSITQSRYEPCFPGISFAKLSILDSILKIQGNARDYVAYTVSMNLEISIKNFATIFENPEENSSQCYIPLYSRYKNKSVVG